MVADRKGLLEEGEARTVLLDEISNASLSFQDRLLDTIPNVLRATEGNVVKTAKLLGIDRKTIQRYVKQYNITKK